MSVELVTGYSGVGSDGEPNRHVSSAEDGARQAGTVGLGSYVLSTGSKMSAIMEDANTLLVSDGDALINGRHVRIPDSLSFTIPTGVQGRKVSSLAVLRYEVGADSVESVTPLVLTGEPSAGTPTDPEYNEGSVLDGDSPVDFPLYRVVTNDINAGSPEPLFDVLMPMADLWGSVPHVAFGVASETNSNGVAIAKIQPPQGFEDRKPDVVLCSIGPTGPELDYQAKLFSAVLWSIDSPTYAQLRVRREDNHEWVMNQGIPVSWMAAWL